MDVIPALVLYVEGAAHNFAGDVGSEHKAVQWVKKVLDENED